jgi:hypothetical protein
MENLSTIDGFLIPIPFIAAIIASNVIKHNLEIRQFRKNALYFFLTCLMMLACLKLLEDKTLSSLNYYYAVGVTKLCFKMIESVEFSCRGSFITKACD